MFAFACYLACEFALSLPEPFSRQFPECAHSSLAVFTRTAAFEPQNVLGCIERRLVSVESISGAPAAARATAVRTIE
jgi:hypothetical protein